MFVQPFHWLVPTGISMDNVWIGYIATYFGAIIGGLISGLFTYLGVTKTLSAQKDKDDEEHKRNNRAILELQEIYGAELYLRNVKNKKGRLIITPQYKNAIALDLADAHFNYIQFRNSGPGKIINCSIKIEIEYIPSNETFTTKVTVPVIFEGENIYVPIDKIKGENNLILTGNKYYIKYILAEYETYTKELIRIERTFNVENNNRLGIDQYFIKHNKDSNFISLYEIKGTENEWYFLEDFDEA